MYRNIKKMDNNEFNSIIHSALKENSTQSSPFLRRPITIYSQWRTAVFILLGFIIIMHRYVILKLKRLFVLQ